MPGVLHVRRKLSIACLLIAWLCANGAVWNVVQVVGWVKMFHDYSSVLPATEALKLTFDGSAPCDLCHISQSAQDQARDQQSPAVLGATDKLVLAFTTPAPVVVLAPEVVWPGLAHEAGLARTETVPVPPPRV
jgi:hypothetical protein